MPKIGQRIVTPWGPAKYVGTAKVNRVDGQGWREVLVSFAYFANERGDGPGPIAVLANTEAGEPYARVSINAPDAELATASGIVVDRLDPWEFIVHHDLNSDLNTWLCCGAFVDSERVASYGHVVDQPVWRLSDAVIGVLASVEGVHP